MSRPNTPFFLKEVTLPLLIHFFSFTQKLSEVFMLRRRILYQNCGKNLDVAVSNATMYRRGMYCRLTGKERMKGDVRRQLYKTIILK